MQMGNKGAFIRFTAPELKPDIVSFSAVVGIGFIFKSYFVLLWSLHFWLISNNIISSRPDLCGSDNIV